MWIFIRMYPSHVKLLLLLLLLLFSSCLQTQTKQAKHLFTYYIRTHHDIKLGIMYILSVLDGFLKIPHLLQTKFASMAHWWKDSF